MPRQIKVYEMQSRKRNNPEPVANATQPAAGAVQPKYTRIFQNWTFADKKSCLMYSFFVYRLFAPAPAVLSGECDEPAAVFFLDARTNAACLV